jgi:hypothetical protein
LPCRAARRLATPDSVSDRWAYGRRLRACRLWVFFLLQVGKVRYGPLAYHIAIVSNRLNNVPFDYSLSFVVSARLNAPGREAD